MSNELCINLAAIQVPNSAGGVNTDSDSKNDSDHDNDNSNININDNDNHDIVTTVIIVIHDLLFLSGLMSLPTGSNAVRVEIIPIKAR